MTSEKKERLDLLLVELGLAESREKAQRIIRAGQVRHGTTVLDKPGVRFAVTTPLEVTALGDRFVSRGGWKLQAALDTWPALTPCPPVCADIGASTGGFTHCLLQHGAERVYTIDVGTAQLDLRLRNDARVIVREQTNARHLTSDSLPEPMDLVVGDVSFISLSLILAPAKSLLKPETGQMIFLIKPQFEAGREHVGKGGVVRDPAVHRMALDRMVREIVPTVGLIPAGLIPSPLPGPKGNREYLIWLVSPENANAQTAPVDDLRIQHAIEEAFAIEA
jgi:23S rRNA (cytidine1920-2'-O)/16S rRNA (cytidine1409-2'-O)-methyltransferase